jgi:hypothetical protein
VTDLDLVMVGEPLSMLRKDGHIADDGVGAIPDYGQEQRKAPLESGPRSDADARRLADPRGDGERDHGQRSPRPAERTDP